MKIILHKEFNLNNHSFSSTEELLKYASEFSEEMHSFLKDWFSNQETISVQTSGSTGVPKTIELRKEFMVNSAIATASYFVLPQKTTALLCLPITYIAGKMMLVRALTLGWHLDVVETTSKPLDGISKSYDFSAMVPLQLENSLDNLHRIKKLIVGGGVISNQLQEKLQITDCNVFATFGMTETITHIAVKKLNRFKKIPNFYEVLPFITIYKDHRDCLVIEAKNLSDKVFFTNDVVQLISKNKFEWLGRFDNVINSGGVKLHPENVEEKLSKVIENRFFVTGIPDEKLGQKLILIIELEVDSDNQEILKEQMISKIRSFKSLSRFEIPKEIFFLNNFTKTISGKIKRKETINLIDFR